MKPETNNNLEVRKEVLKSIYEKAWYRLEQELSWLSLKQVHHLDPLVVKAYMSFILTLAVKEEVKNVPQG